MRRQKIREFIERIREDKMPPVTGEEGRKVMALLTGKNI